MGQLLILETYLILKIKVTIVVASFYQHLYKAYLADEDLSEQKKSPKRAFRYLVYFLVFFLRFRFLFSMAFWRPFEPDGVLEFLADFL